MCPEISLLDSGATPRGQSSVHGDALTAIGWATVESQGESADPSSSHRFLEACQSI